jgi:hypothetical protein
MPSTPYYFTLAFPRKFSFPDNQHSLEYEKRRLPSFLLSLPSTETVKRQNAPNDPSAETIKLDKPPLDSHDLDCVHIIRECLELFKVHGLKLSFKTLQIVVGCIQTKERIVA